jgi:hypothetical protein
LSSFSMSFRKLVLRPILVAVLFWLAPSVGVAKQAPQRLSDPEYVRLIARLCEDPGFFNSDNLISNESSYLQVLGGLRSLRVRDGVYLGVGPEQNFTYIAKTRPHLAIILDIRRQNLLFHWLFKSLFEMSRNRAEYVSYLFCKPMPAKAPLNKKSDVEHLLTFFEPIPPDPELFKRNLALIESRIRQTHHFPLSAADGKVIRDMYKEFFDNQFEIRFRSYGRPMYHFYPSFKEISLEKDLEGHWGNYLNSEEDFHFLKRLQERNLIIPVIGDFAGPKAVRSIGTYVREMGETVSVFYVSNVEFYLLQNGAFGQYGENLKLLPLDEKSLLIRAYFRFPHPERLPGYISATLLQRVSSFIQIFDAKQYFSYQELGLRDYIAFKE